MKNLLPILMIFIITFSACNKEDETTIAEVEVKSNGVSMSGVTVYMFDSNQGPSTSFFTPFFTNRSVVTNSNGVASFELRSTFDLDVINSQTTLYFGVFDNNDALLGQTAITIKEGETKSATINY